MFCPKLLSIISREYPDLFYPIEDFMNIRNQIHSFFSM